MSLPDELLDELLTAHLDGALSDDERARVERMIRDDSEVADRWDDLVRQKALIRSAVLSTPPLPDGFADEVVAAAIRQAEADNLPADHPLMRAAGTSSVSRPATGGRWSGKPIAAVAALAASVLFVGLVARQISSPDDDARNNNDLAELSGDERTPPRGDVIPAPLPPTLMPGEGVAPEPMVAKAESDAESSPSGNSATEIAADPIESVQPALENVDSEDSSGGKTMLADASEPTIDSGPTTERSTVASVTPLQMLMVIQVQMTEKGRQTKAFDASLETVGITEGEARQVSQEFASAATQKSSGTGKAETDNSSKRVLLVESPVKKLDLLVNRLISDRDCVQSVGFSLITAASANGADLLKPLNSVGTIDPTQVRHEGLIFPIESESEEWMQSWSNNLSNRAFAPINNQSEGSAAISMGKTSGPDPMSRILVLIR